MVTCIDTVSAWPCFVAVCTDSPKLQDVIVLSLLCHHQQCLLFCICTLVQSSHEIVLSSGCISHVHWCVVAVVSDLAWIPECIVLFPGGQHKHWKHRDFHSCSEGTRSTCQEDEGTGDSIQCVCVCVFVDVCMPVLSTCYGTQSQCGVVSTVHVKFQWHSTSNHQQSNNTTRPEVKGTITRLGFEFNPNYADLKSVKGCF